MLNDRFNGDTCKYVASLHVAISVYSLTLQNYIQRNPLTIENIIMKFNLGISVAVLIFLLSGCADNANLESLSTLEKVGFFHGIWHGLIILPAFICSLFSDSIAIYAVYNNGSWYNFGYLLGVGGLSLSSGIFAWCRPVDD